MKKIVVTLLALCTLGATFAQKKATPRKKTLGINFFLQDFATGLALDSGDKFSAINSRGDWSKPSRLSTGIAISYAESLTKKIDLRGTISGSFEDYLFKNRPQFGINDFLGELDASLVVKAVNDNHYVIPYVSAGVGLSSYKGLFGAIAPIGVGLQFNFFNDALINLQSQMRLGLTDNTTNHLYHSIGVVTNVTNDKKKAVVADVIAPIIAAKKDTDNDGVYDDADQCPTEAGSVALNGCPDKDNDGIADKNDNCPDKAGVEKYQGCPVPDSDGDGVDDDMDKCPSQAGVAKYQGCPVPDTDGDGVNDDEDKCPTVAGIAANQGCPAIKGDAAKTIDYAAKNILFETASAKLVTSSYKGLNEVVALLKNNPDVKLNIDGHTDSQGEAEKNVVLSQNRANSVMAYLANKGIAADRMTAIGHGADEPIADNETNAGKAKNRRVELKLGY